MYERTIYINAPRAEARPTKAVKRKKYISKTTKYYLLQKSVGIILIALGILSAVITGGGTALVMILFFGLPLVFSKEKILTIPDYQSVKHSGKSNSRNF